MAKTGKGKRVERNPFTVLGLTPGTLTGLDDEQIAILVKHVYRGQITVHHQDRGGQRARNVELNDALERLDQQKNPDSYLYWKNAFLRKKEEKLQDLSKERLEAERIVNEAERIRRAAQDQQYEYWKAHAGIAVSQQGFSIFNLFSTCFLVSDTIQNILRNRVTNRVVGIDPSSISLELEVDPLGAVTMFPLTQVLFKHEHEIPFGTSPEWILGKGSRKAAYLKRIVGADEKVVCRKLDDVRIIGSISDAKLKSDEWNKMGFKTLVPGITKQDGITAQDFDDAKNGFSWERFRHYSALVSPTVTVKDYLVGLRALENEARFIIFGQVMGFKPL